MKLVVDLLPTLMIEIQSISITSSIRRSRNRNVSGIHVRHGAAIRNRLTQSQEACNRNSSCKCQRQTHSQIPPTLRGHHHPLPTSLRHKSAPPFFLSFFLSPTNHTLIAEWEWHIFALRHPSRNEREPANPVPRTSANAISRSQFYRRISAWKTGKPGKEHKKTKTRKKKKGGFQKRGFVKWGFFFCFWSCLPRQGYYCVY